MSQLSYRDTILLFREFYFLHKKGILTKEEHERATKLMKALDKFFESFTISETAELPFRFKDVSEIELTEEEREAALWEGKTKKFHHLRALERNNKNLKA
jgi:hypothetical protein